MAKDEEHYLAQAALLGMGYDAIVHTFYRTIPKSSVINEEFDADTMEPLSEEDLGERIKARIHDGIRLVGGK